jgi:hypothetical protein
LTRVQPRSNPKKHCLSGYSEAREVPVDL